jgi:hypothetical protein
MARIRHLKQDFASKVAECQKNIASEFRLGVGKMSFAQAVLVLLNGSLSELRLLAHHSAVHNGRLRGPLNLVISLFNP